VSIDDTRAANDSGSPKVATAEGGARSVEVVKPLVGPTSWIKISDGRTEIGAAVEDRADQMMSRSKCTGGARYWETIGWNWSRLRTLVAVQLCRGAWHRVGERDASGQRP